MDRIAAVALIIFDITVSYHYFVLGIAALISAAILCLAKLGDRIKDIERLKQLQARRLSHAV